MGDGQTRRVELEQREKEQQERLLCFCQQINQQASLLAKQSAKQTSSLHIVLCHTCFVPHAHTHTHVHCVHMQTCPVGADDYHYPGKYIWPWEPGTLSWLLSLVMWFFSLTFFHAPPPPYYFAPPPRMQTHTLHKYVAEGERERVGGSVSAAEIRLPHQIGNYFSTVVFELRCSKKPFRRRVLSDVILFYIQSHTCIITLITYTTHSPLPFFVAVHILLSVLSLSAPCILSLRLLLSILPVPLFDNISLSLSCSFCLPGVCFTDDSPSYDITHWFKNCQGHWSVTAKLLSEEKVISAC